MSSPAPLTIEILRSAQRGELQKVVKWLRKEGPVDAVCSIAAGRFTTVALLHAAAGKDQLEMVRELLKRGASVDLPTSLGITALMSAAGYDHLSILLLLLQHSANPDLQDVYGTTTLMMAAGKGHEACVKALLRAKANTELLDNDGHTALQRAEAKGHTAIAELIRQHTAPPQSAAASPAATPDAGEPAESAPAPLPIEIHRSAQRGELQKVVKWLRKGGLIDALCCTPTRGGKPSKSALLHVAAANGQLEIVSMLLKRGASVDLPTSFGITALNDAACFGHLSSMFVLLQHSANPDLQDIKGITVLMVAAREGHRPCVKALLRAKADTELLDGDGDTALQTAENNGHTAIAELIRQHAAPATAAPAVPPDAGEPTESSADTVPLEILKSARLGELHKVVKWVRKGGVVDALCCSLDQRSTYALLHIATTCGHLKIVRELLKLGASVDLPTSLGVTALIAAARDSHLSIVLLLLQHSANPDLQDIRGDTALMWAAHKGQEECVRVLLRAKANTELLDEDGWSALQFAKAEGHTAISILLLIQNKHDTVASQLAAAVTPEGMQVEQAAQATQAAAQAAQATRADAAMEELLAEEAAEQAKGQARSKKSKKKKKAGRAAATGDEPSEAPPPAVPASLAAAAPKPAASAAVQAEAALWVAIASGGLSALEMALAAAPHEVREGSVGEEARARRGKLLESQQEAEREAKQEAAAEAARLEAVEQVREVAMRAAAASKARKEAVAAVAKADALERAMAGGGEGGSSGAAGPSEASEAAEVPDDYICPITAEIMIDPVSTADGFTYEREAILEWLRTKDTSPSTGAKLENNTLIPNLSLRSIIRSFVEASAAAPSSPSPAL